MAIVTGAASGIGRAAALGLAHKGARLALLDRDERGLEETLDLVARRDTTASYRVDLGSGVEIAAAFDRATNRFGRVDILVNGAGIVGAGAAFLDVTEETLEQVYAVNLRAPFILMKLAARRMIAQGQGGRIVNVTSGAAHRARNSQAAYGSSKAALSQLTRTAAAELGRYDINVNAVAPGLTLTPLVAARFDEGALAEAVREGPISNLLHRASMPEDIANMIVFLCLPESRQVTAQTIHVSAGATV